MTWRKLLTRINWLDQRIVRKQLDIMTTYNYVQNQGKLMMQCRENRQKPQFGRFFDDFEVNISKLQIFLKNRFHSNWRSYLVLTSGQKPNKLLELVLRKISKCLIIKSIIFFTNLALWLFYLYSPLTSCKKSEKSLELFLRKLRSKPTNQSTNQPTNQPIIINNTDFIGPGWRRSNN